MEERNQYPLLASSLADARAELEAAMSQIAANTNEDWRCYAARVIRSIGASRESFTSDDVWDEIDNDPLAPPVHDRRALGAVMVQLARDGVIVREGYTPSRRRHCSPLPLWRLRYGH